MTALYIDYDGHSGIEMISPCKVLTIDVAGKIRDIKGLAEYQTVLVVFTDDGVPFGSSVMPIHGDRCCTQEIERALERHLDDLQTLRIRRWLPTGMSADGIPRSRLIDCPGPCETGEANQSISVVIATHDRPAELEKCLREVRGQLREGWELIVVDSAPSTDASRRMIESMFPDIRYLRLDTPGASLARNAGAQAARNDIIAFLDDDTIPEANCLLRLAAAFQRHPAIDVVTGLVIPQDMMTLGEITFEAMGGFHRGFVRRWVYDSSPDFDQPPASVELPRLGVSACCAIRKSALTRTGGFNANLGPGSERFESGEDIELFHRIVHTGGILLYEPAAMVRHRHRSRMADVHAQLVDGSRSAAAVWRRIIDRRDTNSSEARRSFKRYRRIAFKQAVQAVWRSGTLPAGVCWKRWYAMVREGPVADSSRLPGGLNPEEPATAPSMATIRVDLTREVTDQFPDPGVQAVEFHVFTGLRYRGGFRLPVVSGIITRHQILDAVAERIGPRLLDLGGASQRVAKDPARSRDGETNPSAAFSLRTTHLPVVSVVVPTRGRPNDLEECLSRLLQQDYMGELEIIVVDNEPGGGGVREIVEQTPHGRYLHCQRPGAAAARNMGFRAARGEIIALTDDDARVPPTWVRQLVAPFRRHDVWMTTGVILPWSLETESERLFEAYGGFQFFDRPVEASARWFRGSGSVAVPVWQLGTSANMAFRRHIIDDDAIGPMREHLGPGTPAGAGEDMYFIYRLLKDGHTVVFDPTIWVYHRHRRTIPEVRRQVYNYGKSQVCYQLETLLHDGDLRSLRMLLWDIPRHKLRRWLRLDPYPPGLLGPDTRGNLAGLYCYFLARWRGRRNDESDGPTRTPVERLLLGIDESVYLRLLKWCRRCRLPLDRLIIGAYRKVRGFQLSVNEVACVLPRLRGAESFLVFGAGNDTPMWATLGPEVTHFVEHDIHWIRLLPGYAQRIHRVNYRTKVSQYKELLNQPGALQLTLPAEITRRRWDVILVDAPPGYAPDKPGRMQSIHAAAQLVKPGGAVFVHDMDREVEQACTKAFLGSPADRVERLALFRPAGEATPVLQRGAAQAKDACCDGARSEDAQRGCSESLAADMDARRIVPYYKDDKVEINIVVSEEGMRIAPRHDREVLLVRDPWYPEDVSTFVHDHRLLNRTNGRNVYYLSNTQELNRARRQLGFNSHHVNLGCFIDDNVFTPGPADGEKRYDAVINARFTRYNGEELKCHYLTAGVGRLALLDPVYESNDPAYRDAYVRRPNCAYYNVERLEPREVARILRLSCCGLVLTPVEGVCRASSEYLLCGIPVVSTPSKGGRDIWYDDYNAVIIEPNEAAVAAAVEQLKRNPRDPQRIRARYLRQAEVFRRRFVTDVLGSVFRHFHVMRDPQEVCETHPFHWWPGE
ncbi:MAG: glycosyltransferase [Arenicellales bacterium]